MRNCHATMTTITPIAYLRAWGTRMTQLTLPLTDAGPTMPGIPTRRDPGVRCGRFADCLSVKIQCSNPGNHRPARSVVRSDPPRLPGARLAPCWRPDACEPRLDAHLGRFNQRFHCHGGLWLIFRSSQAMDHISPMPGLVGQSSGLSASGGAVDPRLHVVIPLPRGVRSRFFENGFAIFSNIPQLARVVLVFSLSLR